MNKNLFNEIQLCKNLPKSVLKEINYIDREIPQNLFDKIFESKELESYVNSMEIPKVEEISEKSSLKNEIKQTNLVSKKKKNKTKRSAE